MFKFSDKSIQLLNTVDKRLGILANEVLKISKIDFGISFGWRSQAEQQKLFYRGASQCDGIINKSKHQEGKAFDFICYVNGKVTWEKKYYYYIAGLLQAKSQELEYNTTWGGFWSFEDAGHCQIND